MRWGLTTDPKCSLCDKPGTLEHVLSSCSTALTQGRYRWRHDSVLRELADWLEKERKKEHGNNPQHGQIAFVKSGDTRKDTDSTTTLQNRSVGSSTGKPTLQNRSVGSSILGGTTGWNMEVDLGKETCFPRCCPNNPKTRHCTVVQGREEAHCHRADSTMGNKV